MLPNLGDDRIHAINCTVEARRKAPVEEKTFWQKASHFFSSRDLKRLIASGTSLSSLKLQGIIPEDLVENQIRFHTIPHSVDDLIDFGCNFNHFLEMGFACHNFSKFEERHYKQLKVRAREMMQTSMSIHDLISLKLTPQQIHSLGWTMQMFKDIGGTKENLKGLCNEKDMSLYFSHHTMKDMGIKPAPKVTRSSKLIF